MAARKRKSARVDPVLPTQGGREMPADPGDHSREEAIRRRAYELYVYRGRKNGHDLEDWLEAEAQVRAEASAPRR